MEERQKIHFTCPTGWCNDPNGLIYIDGEYHLFYQHYPHKTKWGPMHWGHAKSRDLISWENLPIALYPAEDEYCFSGSAIYDEGNISGLGRNRPPLLLFYTAHNPETGEQSQCLAYSEDRVHFEKFPGNPLIPNRISDPAYKKDFRDPKVIKTPDNKWTMVLAAGNKIEFYQSENLLQWEKTGEFFPAELGLSGLCECPDLFPVETESGTAWILSISMIFKNEEDTEEQHVMQYFTGCFTNGTFNAERRKDYPLILDYGKENYAMVSFWGTKNPVMMGWAEDWNRARENTRKEWFGKMTLARKISSIRNEDGIILRQKPIVPENYVSSQDENIRITHLSLDPGQSFFIQNLTIEVGKKSLIINSKKIERKVEGKCNITMIVDKGYLELFADDGIISYSCDLQ